MNQDLVAQAVAEHFRATKGKVRSVIPTPVVKLEAVEGQTMFSEVFGYTPKTGDFPVTVIPDNADTKRFVPHVDASYVVQKREAALLVAAMEDNDKTLITGPTGSGKSSLVKYICAKLNRPFIRVNMSGDIESSSIFGTLVVRGGATVWEDGAITEAVKLGAVCLIDEWELMPAEIAMGMQNLLEDDGYLYLKEKPGTSDDRMHVPHEAFRLVFAGNTVGQGDTTGAFSGVGVQNTATIDRFTTSIELGYLDSEHEVSILTSKLAVEASTARSMVQVAGLIRNAYQQGKIGLTMSPRTLLSWGKKLARYNPSTAFEVSYACKLVADDKQAAQEFFTKVFG